RWCRSRLAVAHPTPDGRCAVISSDSDETAASLETYAPGDGDGWASLLAPWERHGRAFLDAILSPFPPIGPGVRLAARARLRGLRELGRLSVVTARRLGEEHFDGEGGALLVAANALHTDLSPESAGSGLYGWLLCGLAAGVGFPVPEGGAGGFTAALVRRLRAAGGEVRCGEVVSAVDVRAGRAVGVRTKGGSSYPAARAVIADVAAPHLYGRLLAGSELPGKIRAELRRFHWDAGTVKVDWALAAPIPWSAPPAAEAGTVHLADSVDELTRWSADLATGTVPSRPFLVVGQQSMVDPTRQPRGAETAWAYTHVPRVVRRDGQGQISGRWDGDDTAAMVERVERRVEEWAPGFRARILARHVLSPLSMEAADANLDGGAINGGTSHLHQQLIWRPTSGWGRPETYLRALYLASASAHPGGGVHGACGANAARAALVHDRLGRWWR
ncbi:MAG TPA: NAD(P)/FAD-dependent oxidoreductase, partial [Candidatus Dormibacteraeota bacterium]|nr:NAD(P)/FAD-dependent oxidoreductase [Candidatus Dormibacteraeota bacterium]